MPTLPPLQAPGAAAQGSAGAPAAGAPAIATPQQSAIPNVYMDPVTQQSILAQLQRAGWDAAQPVPDIQYVSNGLGGTTPVVKGYNMVISDPKTGATKKVDLTYNPSAPGKGAQWGISGDVGDLPKQTQTTAVGDDKVGWWLPSGPPGADGKPTWKMVVPPGTPNADDEISKAVKRQNDEMERNEKEANFAAGRGYQSDADWAKMASQASSDKLNTEQLAEKVREFNATQGQQQQQFDRQQDAKDKVDAQQVIQSQAQTTLLGAQATQTGAATDIAKAKQGPEIAEIEARTDLTRAQKDKAIQDLQQARQPTPVQSTLGTTFSQYAQVDPTTGKVSFTDNPNYTPTTQAQVAARVGQLQTLMQQKGAEVQGKVGQFIDGKQYTAQDALNDFNAWHDQNIAPQTASLQAAQDDALLQRAKDEASMRQQAYTSALGAGNQQVSAVNARTNMNPVGAGYAQVMDLARQGKMPTGQQMASAFTYQAQDPTQVAQQATQDAYKQMLGGAAGAAPNPQGIDIAGMLNRTNYGGPPGAPAPPPAPAAAAAAAPPAPPNFARPIYAGLSQGTGTPGPQPFANPIYAGLAQGGGAPSPWDFAPNYSFG